MSVFVVLMFKTGYEIAKLDWQIVGWAESNDFHENHRSSGSQKMYTGQNSNLNQLSLFPTDMSTLMATRPHTAKTPAGIEYNQCKPRGLPTRCPARAPKPK